MKALLVDEGHDIGVRLSQRLSAVGWEVCVSDGATQALMDSELDDNDVILVCVPRSGLQEVGFCSALRASGATVPIIVHSRQGEADDVVRGLDCGADDYIVSPVTFAEIEARLRSLTRRATPGDQTAEIECGSLRLDPVRRSVWRADASIQLSQRQFDVLLYLAQCAGRPVTRTELLQEVWDIAFSGRSNVVDQVVTALRARVDRPFGTRSIVTIRGIGYQLQPTG